MEKTSAHSPVPYEPLYHKYRPQSFAELVGQDAISTTLSSALRQQRIAHAYLLTGPRGTGKTSSARILAKSLNCVRSDVPTDQPCGVCEICRSITQGSSLDVIEIDAASNTGVDNIRELIERSQFAPAQCRYKVYVIDECLTGPTLVTTDQGLIRIDTPEILGKKALSYNENTQRWEFRDIVRWLDQGERQTYTIETDQATIKCTGNHLIRTETGWTAAKELKPGVKILSPVNAGAELLFPRLGRIDEFAGLSKVTNSKEIPLGTRLMTSTPFLNKLNHSGLSVLVAVVNTWKFLISCKRRVTESAAFYPIGKGIPTNPNMAFGRQELSTSSLSLIHYPLPVWDSSMEHSWATVPSLTQTNTVVFPGCLGLTDNLNRNGWHIRQHAWQSCDRSFGAPSIAVTERNPFAVTRLAILNLSKCLGWLNQNEKRNKSLLTGSIALHLKGGLGGIWMMDRLTLVLKEAHKFNFILRDILPKKISLWQSGLRDWGIEPRSCPTLEPQRTKPIATSKWEQVPLESGCQTSSNIPLLQWTTSLATVKSVNLAGTERVYDIEVAGNHNFVANGLLVHNCHMLSTAAFNALLKTLEEPPPRVVFILATTDPQRVLPTIISRCQRFDFRRIPLDAMVAHLGAIATKENINIHPDALLLVAQIAQGGLRDAESLLDQLSLLPSTVTTEAVWDLVGAVPEQSLLQLVQRIHQGQPEQVLDSVRNLMDRGREPLTVLQNLASFYRDMLIAKTAPNRTDLVTITPQTWQQLCTYVQALGIELLLRGQQHLRTAEIQVKNTTQPRLWLEVTILGLMPAASVTTESPPINLQKLTGEYRTPPTSPTSQAVAEPSSPSTTPPPVRGQHPSEQGRPMPQPTPPVEKPTVQEPLTKAVVMPAEVVAEGAINLTSVTPSEFTNPPIALELPSPELTPGTATTPLGSAETDLHEIWNQVVAQIQPHLTQVLARQQCRLLAFRGSQARVGIKTQPLLKVAQSKLPNFEAAFQAVFQRVVKVTLEVAVLESESAPATTGSSSSPLPPPPAPASANLPAVSANPAISVQPTPPNVAPVAYIDSVATAPVTVKPELKPAQAHSNSPVNNLQGNTPEVFESPTLTPTWHEPDELERAAQSLADFFRGQVVSLEAQDSGESDSGDSLIWDSSLGELDDTEN